MYNALNAVHSQRCAYWLILSLVLAAEVSGHSASEHHGQVRFGEVLMPGVEVQATQGDKQLRTITDSQGGYSFADLSVGPWTIRVEMPGFAPIRRDLTITPEAAATIWELKMLPLQEIETEPSPGFVLPSPALRLPKNRQSRPFASVPPPQTLIFDDPVQRAANGLLINGSVNNKAASPFAQSPAFGNNRRRGPPLYTGTVHIDANQSALDARSYSLTGQDAPTPAYSRKEVSITLAGPLRIPFLLRDGPRFTLIYSRTRNRNVSLQTARVPTLAERVGDLANANVLTDPATGSPFPNKVIPEERISPQARALLNFYPLPNFTQAAPYNYEIPIVGVTHRDNFQLQTGGWVAGHRLSGSFGFQSTRTESPNLFGFVDAFNTSAVNGTLSWSRRLTEHLSATAQYTFSRTVAQSTPYFADRQNVSGDAGITGNSQDPRDWGPPNLNFAGGTARLFDGQYAFDRTLSSRVSYGSTWSRGRHTLSFGIGFRRQQLNLLSQQDARGTFTFTGAASGSDFGDFLLGIPTVSSIAFGNPDKYFRQSIYDAFVMDDWRISAVLTLNVGLRWDYEEPITERYGRLVNLDIAPGFEAVAPVLASQPQGSLTGQVYPSSLVRSDKGGVQPRIGLAWRPWATSSLVVRAGYGIYRDPGGYRAIATEMAQQSPLSTSLSVENSTSTPLTLANGFIAAPLITPNTFSVDPDLRVGYAQNWQLSIQQGLPAALQVTATYLGTKGTHLPRRILPNTFPSGASNLCPGCPAGYVYLTSNGNSNRHAGTIELRRRQRNGFAASLRYTWSKAIDDAGLGGFHIAQDWQDPGAERALSNFDQRHQMTVQMQYTTGMLGGMGMLGDSSRGTLLRGWTVMTEWRVGSGLPLTPIIIAPVQGTGITGNLRPDRTGAPLYTGTFLNPAAFALPAAGQWGNAGRNSITGPGQFSLDASIGRMFILGSISLDLRVDFMNVLNHVTFPDWNTVVNSAQFGLPTRANSMRTVRPSLRVRF